MRSWSDSELVRKCNYSLGRGTTQFGPHVGRMFPGMLPGSSGISSRRQGAHEPESRSRAERIYGSETAPQNHSAG
jgi:hypothetical protein